MKKLMLSKRGKPHETIAFYGIQNHQIENRKYRRYLFVPPNQWLQALRCRTDLPKWLFPSELRHKIIICSQLQFLSPEIKLERHYF